MLGKITDFFFKKSKQFHIEVNISLHTTFLHDWFPNATLTSHLLHVVIRNSSHDVQTHTLFKRILIYFRRTFVDFSSLKTQIEVQSLFIKEVVDDPECMHCINMREFLRT